MSLLDYHYPNLDDDSDLLRMSTLIEREFINALSLGSGAARSFADRFAHFEQVAQTKLRSDSIEPDSSVAVAHTVALNISTVAGSLIEAEEKADQLSTELFRDIVDVFSTLSLQTNDQPLFMNTAPAPQSKLLHSSSRCSLSKIASSSSIARESTPDYRPSRQWLLQHLHSPYPNLSTRKKLAQQSGVSLKAINEWFTHMRRRVGWTSISRNFFGGNKQLAIDGARCILTEGTGPCYYSEDVIKAFEDMKIKAERLLDGEPNESNLAKRLGNMLGGESSPEDMLQFRSRNSGLRKKRGYIQLEVDECANDHIDGTLPAMDMQPSKRAKSSRTQRQSVSSRTASLSTSISSRASTAEPQTPTTQPLSLPVVDTEESIDRWLSSISNESTSLCEAVQSLAKPSARKRGLSELDTSPPVKRSRMMDESYPSSGRHSPTLQTSSVKGDDAILSLLKQFDFNTPSVALLNSDFIVGDTLQINAFDYASLGGIEPDVGGRSTNESYEGILSDVSFSNDLEVPGAVAHDCQTASRSCNDFVAAGLNLPCMGESLPANNTGSYEAGYLSLSASCPDDITGLPSTTVERGILDSPTSTIFSRSISSDGEGWTFETPSFAEERLSKAAKLGRINQLLAEAVKLQEEVFSQRC